MAVKERLMKKIEILNEQQLHEVKEYVAFLRFRSPFMSPPSFNENRWEHLSNQRSPWSG